jgi:cytochrome P450
MDYIDRLSKGPRQCIGRSISLLEMRLITTVLLQKYEVSFSEDHDPEDFWINMKDQVTTQPGEVWVVFKDRVL